MRWQKTYLGRLWLERRPLFWLMLFLLAGHLVPVVLNYTLVSPFYQWGMYTMPMPATDTYEVYDIRYNEGKPIVREHAYRDLGRMMWLYTLPSYYSLLTTGDTLPVQTHSARAFTNALSGLPHSEPIHVTHQQLLRYPAWLRRYLQQETQEPVYRLEVNIITVKYEADGRLKAGNKVNFIQYP